MNTTTFKCEPVKTIADARGLLFEPVSMEEMHAHKNAHIVVTEPGHIRGNHFHKHSGEITVVTGATLVRVKIGDEIQEFSIPEGQAWKFHIPPQIPHAFKNVGNRPTVLIGFNTALHDPNNPDTFREVLIES
jgi:UDP-2-acetamido-2,6-beta-L-arabino-hexul-4-ose reductase